MDNLLIGLITLIGVQGVLLMVPPIIIKTDNQKWLRGATARNNPVCIWINPEQKNYKAVLAQETYECETRKWLYNLAKWWLSDDYKRIIEATGQEIEVQMYVDLNIGVSETNYRRVQAETLANKYNQFAHWSVNDIESMMFRQRDLAQRWIRNSEEFGG